MGGSAATDTPDDMAAAGKFELLSTILWKNGLFLLPIFRFFLTSRPNQEIAWNLDHTLQVRHVSNKYESVNEKRKKLTEFAQDASDQSFALTVPKLLPCLVNVHFVYAIVREEKKLGVFSARIRLW
jgi:hypothetical protein